MSLGRRHTLHVGPLPLRAEHLHQNIFGAKLVVVVERALRIGRQYFDLDIRDRVGGGQNVDLLLECDLGLIALLAGLSGLLRQHRRVDPERFEDLRLAGADHLQRRWRDVGKLQNAGTIFAHRPDGADIRDEAFPALHLLGIDGQDRNRMERQSIGRQIERVVGVDLKIENAGLDQRSPLENAGLLLDRSAQERDTITPERIELAAEDDLAAAGVRAHVGAANAQLAVNLQLRPGLVDDGDLLPFFDPDTGDFREILADILDVVVDLRHRRLKHLAGLFGEIAIVDHLVDFFLGPAPDDGDAAADFESFVEMIDRCRHHHHVGVMQDLDGGACLLDRFFLDDLDLAGFRHLDAADLDRLDFAARHVPLDRAPIDIEIVLALDVSVEAERRHDLRAEARVADVVLKHGHRFERQVIALRSRHIDVATVLWEHLIDEPRLARVHRNANDRHVKLAVAAVVELPRAEDAVVGVPIIEDFIVTLAFVLEALVDGLEYLEQPLTDRRPLGYFLVPCCCLSSHRSAVLVSADNAVYCIRGKSDAHRTV